MFVKKRPEHKTSARTLVGKTMNCNCISILEGTSKLVKRLRQDFLLIKQSIPLFALLQCHFRFLKTTIRLFEPIMLFLKSSVLFTPCFVIFSTSSFKYSSFSFLLYFGNLFASIFHFLKQFCIQTFPTTKKYSANRLRSVMTTLSWQTVSQRSLMNLRLR